MSSDSSNQIPHEKEVTLLISSERLEELEKEIAGLSEIRGYFLSPASSETIEDTYLDTADKRLAIARWALRIRKELSGHWVTLKGPSRLTEWGGLERPEMEAPWSNAALQGVLTILDRANVWHGTQVGSFNPANPIETMRSLSFDIIQSRGLQRRRRTVAEQGGKPEVAELAIDDVTYRFVFADILHSEVEIEAKTAGGSSVVKEMVEELLERYGAELIVWPYGKLATGKAIEQLWMAGKLTDLMNGNRLQPAAYAIVAEFLRSRTSQK